MIRTTPSRHAFTLLELSLSLMIVATVTLALGSAVVIASRAVPTDDAPGLAATEQMRALQQIRLDIGEALFFRKLTATGAEVILSDRNGDGASERIVYDWDGIAGHALTRSINGGSSEVLIPRVQDFTIKRHTRTASRTIQGALREQNESPISRYTNTSSPKSAKPDGTYAVGVSFTPEVPVGTERWRLVGVDVYASEEKVNDGKLLVRLCEADANNLPTNTILAEVAVPEIAFEPTDAWTRINLTADNLRPGQRYAITFHDAGAGKPVKLRMQQSIPNEPAQSFVSTNGSGWTESQSDSLIYRVYGVSSVREPSTNITRTYTQSFDIALVSSVSHIDAVACLNIPENLSTRIELDFTRDPTTVDADGDGTPDWTCTSVFDDARLSKGIWTVTQRIRTTMADDLTTLTTIDASMRDSTDDGMNGVMLGVVCDVGAGQGAILGVRVRRIGTEQIVDMFMVDASDTIRTISTTRMGTTEFLDIRLVIDPANDLVNLLIDGTEIDSFGYPRITTALGAGVWITAEDLDPGAQIDDLLMTVYAP